MWANEKVKSYKMLVGKNQQGRRRRKWTNNTTMDLAEIERKGVACTHVVPDKVL
jgi:hypothetical protein